MCDYTLFLCVFHFQDVERDLKSLQENIKVLRTMSRQISLLLCEDDHMFSLHECFNELFDFVCMVKSAQVVSNFLDYINNIIL